MIKSIKHRGNLTYSLRTLAFFNANTDGALACRTQVFLPFASHVNVCNTVSIRSRYPNPNRTLPLKLKARNGGLS
jgi:hypothetical protein